MTNKLEWAMDEIEALSADQAALLEMLLERQPGHAAVAIPRIARDEREAFLAPTSWAQQRLWFFDQLQGGSAAYNIPLGLRLTGPLDLAALHDALSGIVQRHEVLRTVFVSVDAEARQQIARTAQFELPLVDLTALQPAQQQAHIDMHKTEEAQTQFNLRLGPLIRARLLRMRADEHLLLVTMHHIVSDGWSIGVFLTELARLYDCALAALPDPLEPLPIQYADYAQWQRQWLSGEVLERQLSYWQGQLRGAPTQLDLPADRPRPAVQSYRGDSVRWVINAALTRRLQALAESHGMTLFMVLFAGWTLLLSRLSGQHDIVIGSPIAGRRRPELEGLIGFFVNMLALRVNASGAVPLRDFLQHVREVTVSAYDHQDIPFEQLVETLRPERSLSRHPIFQAAFVLQNAPHADPQLSGLKAAIEPGGNDAAKFDLLLELEERGKEICGRAVYAADLFGRRTIERWLRCFNVLLAAIAVDDEVCIGDLPMLADDERHLVLHSFNATQQPYPRDKLIHELFEERVRNAPAAPAVIYRDDTLTYAELNGRANQLAHFLRAQGVGPDRLVGLCLERGVDLPVAMLGVLKAGGAYVPLDPTYPLERLAYMLADAAPVVLLTQERLRAALPPPTCRVVALDSEWSEIALHAVDDLPAHELGLTPDHLANVIYTSGSTGRPKGVMVPHRGVCNLAVTQLPVLRMRADSRVLQFASTSFDACTWEWTSAFCAGACLCLASRDDLAPGEPLRTTLQALQVTHAILAPVALGSMSSSQGLERLSTLTVGGEACPEALVQRWAAGRRFINGYGPTEITVCASLHICDERETGNPPIGRPIGNMRIYILDERRQPVPIGVTGELFIAGVGVTPGYLHRPDLTAERFAPDPWSADPQARMYRSGDLGRWRADGAIEYLGRNDDQVKIRGLRIELGEIESQLARHPQVREATVMAREDTPGDKRLVAYVVATDANSLPGLPELREHLKAILPEYMVPSAFVMLERLPVTPVGKIDRRALPGPDLTAYVTHRYEPPRGPMESLLADVWQALLRVERVGRQDNFFELGGHSLLIVQMMERLRRLGLAAEVRSVFDSPTLADLARVLDVSSAEELAAPPNLIPEGCTAITPQMLPLVQLDREQVDLIAHCVAGGATNVQDIYPLAPLQEGILFHHLLDMEAGDTYVLPLVFEVSSRQRLNELIAALQAVIDRHDVLRTAVLWDRLPRPVQVVYRHAELPVSETTLDAQRDSDEQVQQWLRPERQRLDIRRAPLMRLQVAADPRQNGRWYALLQLHHITIDHLALQIVTGDVVAHLERRTQIRRPTSPYRNHVAQALAYARKHDAQAFFRGKLGDVEEPTAPFGLLDVHGDGSQIDEGREYFDLELAKRIRDRARREGVSPATLFHAAWAVVVAHTSGRSDVVFGSVLLGRLQGSAGAQQTLGMFINTLPLRLQLHDTSAAQLVERAQRELVELLDHEQASLAEAQRCSGICGSAPLFSALLNYRHSVPDPQSEWSSAQGIRALACQERTNYPITMSIDDLGEGFGLAALVDRQVGPQRVIGYLRTAMVSLLEALERAPQTAALQLSILPEAERRQVIDLLNATQAAYPPAQLIHRLFEQQTQRSPDVVAVGHGTRALSYLELNMRANQLARHLLAAGAGPQQLVAICLDRSVEMVVGLLAILKTGAAYLPLDPSYPPERLQHMLDDAVPRVTLTESRLLSVLPPRQANVVTVDQEWLQIERQPADDLTSAATAIAPDEPLYVIYTSGSTGRPKGTVMPHRAMCNLLQWHRADARLRQPRRVLQFAALSFDVAFQETFSTLCTGGTLVLLDERIRRDARALLELLASESIERLFVPPLMLQSLAECFEAGACEQLKLQDVITAGEQLRISPEIVRFFGHLEGCWLHNHYGPTETHVVTALAMSGSAGAWPGLPTIGRPIANTQIYVLDAQRQPSPQGVVGEIYIGGANVACGYLRRAELTAERFVRDPWSSTPGACMYKTGDLGRWRSDGSIEYLGRNDDQVKIRGYRIELGEIELLMASHPKVREAAVIAREDAPGQKRLVAYVTGNAASPATADELRSYLKSALPDHMLPSAFVQLEKMPLTPSGKLNRRALPAPEVDAYTSNKYVQPQGAVEQQLAQIWQDVLGLERIGRDDHFFESGGHSLLALKLLLRINQALGCTLRVADVYKSPTIVELAGHIRGDALEDAYVDLSREAVLDDAIVPLSGARREADRSIFLTGATGFVGRFLLAQLLQETDATVYCQVRAPSQRQAAAKLKATLLHWDLWTEQCERIVAVAGDLRLPNLGLDEATYRAIARDVDGIYHCATSMNHLETYAMAKAANVDSAAQLLKLATCDRPKLVNYVSTLGVFGAAASDPPRVVDESTPIEHERYRYSQGYLASKWVAERIFMIAARRGIPCNIFRLGLVWADSRQGRYDELQNVYRIMKSCLLSGCGIENYRYPMPPTPVDYVARALVFLGTRHRDGGGIFHVASSDQMLDGVFERCNEIAGTALDLMPYYAWICELKRLHQQGQVLPAVPILEYAFALDEQSFQEQQRSARSAVNVRFDFSRTHRELEEAGIVAPVLDDELLEVCLEGMLARDPQLREVPHSRTRRGSDWHARGSLPA